MRPASLITLALCCATLAAKPAARPQAPSARILAEARRILNNARNSSYSHKTRVNESTGQYDVDCSGLVCVILKKVAPRHLAVIPIAPRQKRARAAEFYNAFSDPTGAIEKRWNRIDRLADAKPGDILAWRARTLTPGKSTGHVVILDSSPIPDGDGIFRVTIIDSTGGPHANDTRKPPTTGVGRGTMWFKVDSSGRPIAYRWRAAKGPFRETLMAVGRAK